MTSPGLLAGFYDYRLVAISVLVAILSVYVAIDLGRRAANAKGRRRNEWLCGGSFALGICVLGMHTLGMAAYHLPVPVQYAWPIILLSLPFSMVASGVGLAIVSGPSIGTGRALASSFVMGCSLVTMHFTSVKALRLLGVLSFSPSTVAVSIVLATAFSYLALRFGFTLVNSTVSWVSSILGCCLLMSVTIPIMYYIGMPAVNFRSDATVNANPEYAVSITSVVLTSIVVSTLGVICFLILASRIDRRFAAQARDMKIQADKFAAQSMQVALQAQQIAQGRLRIQHIFDNMREGITLFDHEMNLIQINQAARDLLGLPDQALAIEQIKDMFDVHSPDGELLHPWKWPLFRALHGEFCQGEELMIRRKDIGKTIYAEVSTAPIVDSTGAISEIIVGYRDITERKQLDETRNRLAAIVESSGDAIFGKDLLDVITSWNKGAEKMFGYSESEMIGQSITRLLPLDREQEEATIMEMIKDRDAIEHLDTVRKRKDGSLFHVSLTVSPIKDAFGRIIGVSQIVRDVTERFVLERQLRQSQKMEAVGQLTGGIAHDFNNLLGIIIGNLDLLEFSVADNQSAIDQVQSSQRAALRGADLTRRLLAFARMEGLKPTATSVNEPIDNTVKLAVRTIGPEFKITTKLAEGLPQVFVDVAGLESALLNLVLNSRDAMPSGGLITISTKLSPVEDASPSVRSGELSGGLYACIAVSDTGCGMSRETVDRACEPFFTTKPRDKGTGLGLALVYGFVKQSGGIVRIYSELGVGTTVALYFPVLACQSQEIREVKFDEKVRLSGSVLVVDDEPDLLKVAVVYLTEMGCRALRADSSFHALKLLENDSDIDVILTDIVMPGGMNGVELAKKIRHTYPQIKIRFSSGFPAAALTDSEPSVDDTRLLQKPYQRAEFYKVIREALEERNDGSKVDRKVS